MCAVLVRGEVVCLWSSLLMELGVCEVRSSECCVRYLGGVESICNSFLVDFRMQ